MLNTQAGRRAEAGEREKLVEQGAAARPYT